MEYIQLGELCGSKIGKLSRKEEGLIDYIDISSVDNKEKKIVSFQTVEVKDAPSRAQQLLRKNDILVSTVRPNLNAVAVCDVETDNILVGSTGYCVLRCKEDVDHRYVFNYCKSKQFISGLEKVATGASYPAVSNKDIRESIIPLVDLETQKKISNVLDKAQQLIDKRKEQIETCDELIKSQFIEMFGDPFLNPKGYETVRLGDLALKVTDGVHAKPEYTTEGRPFISVVNITKRFVDFTNCKYVSEEAYQKMIKSTHPERGDILYTKVGATYGIPAYIDTDVEFCLYVSVCLIKPKHELINSKFLALSMDMPYVKIQADKRIKGIGVPDLHLNQIREFMILCPPREEQEKFIDFVQQVDKLKFEMQQSLVELENNFNALMQKAFKGELF